MQAAEAVMIDEGESLEESLDNDHAAAFLDIAPSTLENWRTRARDPKSTVPRIPYIKNGRSIRYRLRDLRAHVAAARIAVAQIRPWQQTSLPLDDSADD